VVSNDTKKVALHAIQNAGHGDVAVIDANSLVGIGVIF
jgi:regulator of RNase E activity RraA